MNERALISRSGGLHPARVGLYVLLSLLAALGLSVVGFAQTPPDETPTPLYKFFSGSVVEVTSEHVVVRRSPLARAAQTRTFRITADTQIEGNLEPKARVTVGYISGEEGDTAARIIVRTPAKRRTSSNGGATGRTSISRVAS